MKKTTIACALACVLAGGWLPAPVEAAGEDVKLTGCLVRGEDDDDGYLLTNVPGATAFSTAAGSAVEPGPVGTSGAAAVFYWLEDDDDLEAHVGHQVEVTGEVDDDLEAGEITVDRQRDWTEIEVRSDGRELKARVPHSLFVVRSGGGARDDDAIGVIVRTVDVDDVRMLAARCEP